MTYTLGPPSQIGQTTVAVITQQCCTGHLLGQGLAFTATKRPVIVLVVADGAVRAFDMVGTPLPLAAADAVCLAAISTLREYARKNQH